jgi:hypothetical protein
MGIYGILMSFALVEYLAHPTIFVYCQFSKTVSFLGKVL